MDDFSDEDFKDAASTIRDRMNQPDLAAVLSNRMNIILGALDVAPWFRKLLADARVERSCLIDSMTRCEELLNGVGMPDDHHEEERPLSLDERVEALVAEYEELRSELEENASNYIKAVSGRKEFRSAFARERASRMVLEHALHTIASQQGKTIIGSGRYDEGAHDAFDVCSDIAKSALDTLAETLPANEAESTQ